MTKQVCPHCKKPMGWRDYSLLTYARGTWWHRNCELVANGMYGQMYDLYMLQVARQKEADPAIDLTSTMVMASLIIDLGLFAEAYNERTEQKKIDFQVAQKRAIAWLESTAKLRGAKEDKA